MTRLMFAGVVLAVFLGYLEACYRAITDHGGLTQ